MNGSNSLHESDRQQLVLCPRCLRKLHYALGFDILRRYALLLSFYQGQGLTELASWTRRRLAELRTD
jgi:archaemetzincin